MSGPASLPQVVATALRSLQPLGRILIGVSGGADSVALLRCLDAERAAGGCEVVVGHLNHLLRGSAADADADWVRDLCLRLSVPVHIERLDVASQAHVTKRGIEEAARGARYAFLQAIALRVDASAIAVAHTADDQAETVLHHVLRGTGLAGLSGMPLSRTLDSGQRLIRPLLQVHRTEVLQYLRSLGQDYREDATNTDETLTRNRIRLRLLPWLKQEFNPAVVESLTRLSAQSSELQEAVTRQVERLVDLAVTHVSPTECEIDCTALVAEPRHFVRELFVQLWRQQNWPRQAMGFAHWNSLAELVQGDLKAMHFPGGIQARRHGDTLRLHRN